VSEPLTRRIILLRHAKAVPHDGNPNDHVRALSGVGRAEAESIGRKLAALGWIPELVSSSDSARTKETLALALPHWPGARVETSASLYLTGLSQLRIVARDVPADVSTWLVLGHNPGWEEAVEQLTGQSVELGTANAALLEGTGATVSEAIARGNKLTLVDVLQPD
jgi:phosphohistidine phosphatase SixA